MNGKSGAPNITPMTRKTVDAAIDALYSLGWLMQRLETWDPRTLKSNSARFILEPAIDKFVIRWCSLEALLHTEGHDIELRRIYEPHCVRFDVGFPEGHTISYHDSFSEAVYICASTILQYLPFEVTEAGVSYREIDGLDFKSPQVNFDELFSDEEVADEDAIHSNISGIRETALGLKFNFLDLLTQVQRELTTVVDRLNFAQPASDPWSRQRSKSDWLIILEHLGSPMSDQKFHDERKAGTYKEHPSTAINRYARSIKLLKETLPIGYSDQLVVRNGKVVNQRESQANPNKPNSIS